MSNHVRYALGVLLLIGLGAGVTAALVSVAGWATILLAYSTAGAIIAVIWLAAWLMCGGSQ